MKESGLSRRIFLRVAFVMAVSLSASCFAGNNQSKPNIIFFIADDMYPEMFNCLPEGRGKNLTPNIDRLASEGVLMMGQHVVSPVCTPSRYNCLTGRYASRATNDWFQQTTEKNAGQTVVEFNSHITQDDVTIAKLLKAGGYKTGMVGKNHVIDVHDLYAFPDYNASAKDSAIAAKLKENSQKIKQAAGNVGFDYAASVYHNNPNFIGLGELAVQNMDWITKGGLDFIDMYKDEPFFLYFASPLVRRFQND
jgi:arylsulfatase A-like enzyme